MKLRIDIHPVMSEDERLKGLSDGTFDLIACNLQATSEMKDSLLLTSPIVLTRQVLVQRKAGIGKVPLYQKSAGLSQKNT
jgi:ABC-type amino acid transport substrate-binding protein